MNLKPILTQVAVSAETMLLQTALHFAQSGKIEFQHLDTDAIAAGLFAIASQLETEHPGTAAKYGWTAPAKSAQ